MNNDPIREALEWAHSRAFGDGMAQQRCRDALAALSVLRQEHERLREALEAVEWNGYTYIGLEPCPACGQGRVKGHADGCIVGAALAADAGS